MHTNGSGYLSSSLGSLPRGPVALLPKGFFWLPNPCWAAFGQLGGQKQKSFQEREVRDHICFPPSYHVVIIFYFPGPLCLWQNEVGEPALPDRKFIIPSIILNLFLCSYKWQVSLQSSGSLSPGKSFICFSSLRKTKLPQHFRLWSLFLLLSSAWLDFASLGLTSIALFIL